MIETWILVELLNVLKHRKKNIWIFEWVEIINQKFTLNIDITSYLIGVLQIKKQRVAFWMRGLSLNNFGGKNMRKQTNIHLCL